MIVADPTWYTCNYTNDTVVLYLKLRNTNRWVGMVKELPYSTYTYYIIGPDHSNKWEHFYANDLESAKSNVIELLKTKYNIIIPNEKQMLLI